MRNANRTQRDHESRATEARVDYQPPSALPEPDPHPDWSYRWIATHVLGVADAANASKKMREGWEPVRAEDHPEMQAYVGKSGNIEVGGLILCKMPRERVDARNAYYSNQARRQLESVDNSFMRINDDRMPLFNKRKSRVERGTGFGSGS